jgi:hypothetical protein
MYGGGGVFVTPLLRHRHGVEWLELETLEGGVSLIDPLCRVRAKH